MDGNQQREEAMGTKTTATKVRASEVLGKEKVTELAELLGYLAARWSDEAEYEDFSEYEATFSKAAGSPARLRQRPFSAWFVMDGYAITMTLDRRKGLIRSTAVKVN